MHCAKGIWGKQSCRLFPGERLAARPRQQDSSNSFMERNLKVAHQGRMSPSPGCSEAATEVVGLATSPISEGISKDSYDKCCEFCNTVSDTLAFVARSFRSLAGA